MKRSWRTTLLGIAAGAIPIVHGGVQAMAEGQHVDWWQVLMGVGIIALGTAAKDSNVTHAPTPGIAKEAK